MKMYFSYFFVASCFLTAVTPSTIQGFNSGATSDGTKAKVQSDFESEFKAAQSLQNSPGVFNSVRLYTNIQAGTTNTPIEAIPAAIATNTSMLLGLWCSGTTNITNELTAVTSAISQYGSKFTDLVVGISVGSEDLYRASSSGIANNAGVGQGPAVIKQFIQDARNTIRGTALGSKPIGHVDSWSAWVNGSNSAVLDAVDFVGVDLYPYYETNTKNSFANASVIFNDLYHEVLSVTGNKSVWITETGWPTSGATSGQAVASVSNAQGYWKEVGCTLFGRVNIWWYDLKDSNGAITEKFAIAQDLTSTPAFNLTCPSASGAPTTINFKATSGAGGLKGISYTWRLVGVAAFAGLLGWLL